MNGFPCLIRSLTPAGEARFGLGDPLVDSYSAFVAGRARPNTLRAVAHDLKTFFGVIGKDPVEVVAADIFDFVAEQRGDRTVIRISDGESGLSARTIARRLSSISGLYAYLVARGDTPVGAMALSSLSEMTNANRLRRFVPPPLPETATPRPVEPAVETGEQHATDGAATVTDPVCGMRIDPVDAAGTIDQDGRTHHFCSIGCRDAFTAEPRRYVQSGAKPQTHGI